MGDQAYKKGIFEGLNENQAQFVRVMVENPDFTKKEAAQAIGVKPRTVYEWGSELNDVVDRARADQHAAAMSLRKKALLKAIQTKVDLLDSDDERIRDKAATDIIEWELGKAMQPSDITSGGEPLRALTAQDLSDDDLASIIARGE